MFWFCLCVHLCQPFIPGGMISGSIQRHSYLLCWGHWPWNNWVHFVPAGQRSHRWVIVWACSLVEPDQRLRFISSHQEGEMDLGLAWEVAWALGSPEEWTRKHSNCRAQYLQTLSWTLRIHLHTDRFKWDRPCPHGTHSPSMRGRPQVVRQVD